MLRGCLLLVAVGFTSACRTGADGGGICSTLDELCGGATSCYATCFCQSGDDTSCRASCSLTADSPLILDVSAWASDPGEGDLVALMNAQRVKGGCCAAGSCFDPAPALATDSSLTLAARRHAADMTDRGYFSHDTPEGLTFEDRIRAAGYRGCSVGEDLAAAYATADEVVAAWLASTDHCENLFWPSFSTIGVARSTGPASGPGVVWVADFGG